MKIYYEILKIKGLYVVMKTVENHGIACKSIFRGLKAECINFCNKSGIKPINVK